jgi:ATP-dependent exoDNAse (exonuclease V) alpha subunit
MPVPVYVPPDRTRSEHIASVRRVVFTSPSRDFVILESPDGATILGPVADPDAFTRGACFRFLGRWEDNDTRGLRFRFTTFVPHATHTRPGVIAYLSKTCSGIGEKTADRLWQKYGGEAVELLRTDPARVASELRLSPELCQSAADELASAKKYEATRIDLFALTAGRGFSGAFIEAAIHKWGVRAPAMLRKNPFNALGLPSAGFRRCDKLWCDLELPKDATKRGVACLVHLLASDQHGNTWVCAPELDRRLKEVASGCNSRNTIRVALRARKIKKHRVYERPGDPSDPGVLWLATYARATAEERIAASVARLASAGPTLWPTDRIPVSREDGDGLPSEHQVERLKRATILPLGLFLGGPGCGKTHTLAYLLKEVIAEHGMSAVRVACPTGKASTRATQALKQAGIDLRATTMHSMLEIGRNGHDGDGWGFKRNRSNPLDAKFYVIDECFVRGTMVDTPSGPSAIESIRVGDDVYSAAGVDTVYGLSRKAVSRVIRITAGETSFTSSEGHRFFTTRGYVRADEVRPGDTLVPTAAAVRLLREDNHSQGHTRRVAAFLRSSLLCEMVDADSGTEGEVSFAGSSGQVRTRAIGLPSVWNAGGECPGRTDSETEPNEPARGSCQTLGETPRDEAQATDSRWQRSPAASAAATLTRRAGSGVGGGTSGFFGRTIPGIPDELQARPRITEIETRNRGGRAVAQHGQGEKEGREEGWDARFPRVDRVEILESGHPDLDQCRDADGRLYLYDLAVARHPSFSVGGCLVHNCSMVDGTLMADMLDAIPNGGHVLFVGDPHQLPPVGHGAPLRDLLAAGVPHGELTEVRRNAGQIVHACVRIKNGESFDTTPPDELDIDPPADADGKRRTPPKNLAFYEARDGAKAVEVLCNLMREGGRVHGFDATWQTQVIVARNTKGDVSRKALNAKLHPMLNPDGFGVTGNPFKVGDKIICLRNSWMPRVAYIYGTGGETDDELGAISVRDPSAVSMMWDASNFETVRDEVDNQPAEVYVANGEIGRVVAVSKTLTVARFSEADELIKIPMGKRKDEDEDEAEGGEGGGESEKGQGCNFDHAYAISCHKAQGSQAPCIIVMGDDQAAMLTTREWLYTAVSRAAKLCVLIGKMATFEKMKGKAILGRRKTFCREQVQSVLWRDL